MLLPLHLFSKSWLSSLNQFSREPLQSVEVVKHLRRTKMHILRCVFSTNNMNCCVDVPWQPSKGEVSLFRRSQLSHDCSSWDKAHKCIVALGLPAKCNAQIHSSFVCKVPTGKSHLPGGLSTGTGEWQTHPGSEPYPRAVDVTKAVQTTQDLLRHYSWSHEWAFSISGNLDKQLALHGMHPTWNPHELWVSTCAVQQCHCCKINNTRSSPHMANL